MSDQRLMTADGARLFVCTMGGLKGGLSPLLTLHGAPGVQTHEDSEAAFGFLTNERRGLLERRQRYFSTKGDWPILLRRRKTLKSDVAVSSSGRPVQRAG
jgi:hypothetical protein